MERNIKFRGRTKHGAWLRGSLLQSYRASYIIDKMYFKHHCGFQLSWLNESCKVDPKTIGQYIGRHDKNGIEIYEGDILQYPEGQVVSVVYDNTESKFVLMKPDCDIPITFHPGREAVLEVVDNIHDNPEQLSPTSQTN